MDSENIVDMSVKELMLSHFVSFPTRMHALNHILLMGGNGYEWVCDKDGYQFPLHNENSDTNSSGTMTPMNSEESSPSTTRSRDSSYRDVCRVNTEFQWLITGWANRNIDVIASPFFSLFDWPIQPPTPSSEHLPRSLLSASKLPSAAKIHPQWKREIIRFCNDTMTQIRRLIMCSDSFSDTLWRLKQGRPDLSGAFELCYEVIQKLDRQANNPTKSSDASQHALMK